MCVFSMLSGRRKVVGLNQVKRAVKKGEARLVFVARDVDADILKDLVSFVEEFGVELQFVDSKEELGRLAGIKRAASSVALLK